MRHALVVLCGALMFSIAACGGGGDGGGSGDLSGDVDNDNDPGDNDDNNPPDSLSVCDPCTPGSLTGEFGQCLAACRTDCPDQFSECRDACLDECDGCGTGLSCLSNLATQEGRCGPNTEVTTCDGVDYGG